MASEFAKEKVIWTPTMNSKLVRFLRNKRHIWDPGHLDYTSVTLRDRTYAEFAAKYGKFSGQAVKERWTNIRCTFASYLRKVRIRQERGEEFSVNWHLWEDCQFLTKVNKKGTKHRSNGNEAEEKSDHDDDLCERVNFSIKDNTESSTSEEEFDRPDNSLQNGQNELELCKEVTQGLVSIFKGIQNDSFGLDNSRNGRLGREVARKLSDMPSIDAARVSLKIMEVLLKYDETNPDNPNA